MDHPNSRFLESLSALSLDSLKSDSGIVPAYAGRRRPQASDRTRWRWSLCLVFVFFFLLFFFGFSTAYLGETFVKGSLSEQVGGEAGVVLADGKENLTGATAVAVGGDLHGCADAVHELEIGVDVGLDVAIVHGFIGRGNDGA